MIDRVNNLIQGQNQLQNDRRNSPADSNRASQESPGSGRPETDQVSLSESGRQMQSLEQRVAESTGVDQERVAALRDAIERGDYEADASRIADALIRDSREL
ncbi:flagellar biosynthesis anti-sigma factor FlgM [Natronospira proteinivora]|uniref:Negative regulator of flagellin synthesis n=1 Tax=Natronospira proteinivora TaxID=1807133 RepID=A0ABT1G8Y2_9GAMM|nr:flagellar biosynthesis anti-sigma factor FlgM [Natronospira proteinivora]MCP1726412.1 flagellar biosynthesis anti-sigma factor FlgM [Natronospira proteinivora]